MMFGETLGPQSPALRRSLFAFLLVLALAVFAAAQQQPSNPPAQPQQPETAPAGEPAAERGTQAAPPKPARPTGHNEFVIKGGTLLTVTHGRIANGQVYVKDGKIVAVGQTVPAPPTAKVIDATGKWVTPGLIDAHSHVALDNDVNEATSPITPHMNMLDAFQYTDKGIYRALAGGTTTSLLLHGSANMIGGQAVVIKHKYGMDRDDLLFPGAPRSIKFASGENPKRVYGGRQQTPATRMGNFAVMRAAFQETREYMRDWDDYNAKVQKGEKDAKQPKRDLKLDALADILRGKLLVQIHCYRADEFLTEMAIAREFGYKIRAFHHGLEVYKVAGKVAAEGIALATFSDWYGYKMEANDAIPWNAVISMRKGVRVAIKSDSDDLTRRLNQEAAKTMHYGGATEDEALKMVTLNPAWVIGVDDKVGSLDAGKDADIVIWDKYPLSSYATPEKVLIDGDVFFDKSLPGYGMPYYTEGK